MSKGGKGITTRHMETVIHSEQFIKLARMAANILEKEKNHGKFNYTHLRNEKKPF